MQDKKPIFLTINVSLNPLQTDVTLLANNSRRCSTWLEAKLLRPFVRSFRVVRKEISTMKRRCHHELESVLLWLSFLIATEETGYEYWQTVRMKTTVFSFLV